MFKTKNLTFKDFISYNDLHIIKSKINFVTGESGCGKSTLLKLLNRTENFSGGEIFYKNQPLHKMDSIALRKEVKLISQTPFLFNGTIEENFALFYHYCETTAITEECMKFFLSLTEAPFPPNTLCNHLSGGEKQRVYLAICLSMDAETILLDEPTSALDFDLSVKVFANIVSYAKKHDKTLVAISHSQALITQFAENIIPLHGGKKQ